MTRQVGAITAMADVVDERMRSKLSPPFGDVTPDLKWPYAGNELFPRRRTAAPWSHVGLLPNSCSIAVIEAFIEVYVSDLLEVYQVSINDDS